LIADLLIDKIRSFDSETLMEKLFSGASSCWCFLSKDKKTSKNILVFGCVDWGTPEDFIGLIQKIELLAGKWECSKILGPLNYSTYFDYRVKKENPEDKEFEGEPTQPSWALENLEKTGFHPEKEYVTQYVKLKTIRMKFLMLVSRLFVSRKLKNNFIVRTTSEKEILENLKTIYDFVDEIFQNNYAYKKIPYEVFAALFKAKYIPLICYETTHFLFNLDQKILGFILIIKNENNPKTAFMKTIAIRTLRHWRGKALLYLASRAYANAPRHYKFAVACLMPVGNRPDKVSNSMAYRTTHYYLYSKTSVDRGN